MTRPIAWHFAQAASLAVLIGFFVAEVQLLAFLFPERFG